MLDKRKDRPLDCLRIDSKFSLMFDSILTEFRSVAGVVECFAGVLPRERAPARRRGALEGRRPHQREEGALFQNALI